MDESAWRGCATRGAVALALIVALGLGGAAVGSTWGQAVAIGASTVGTWFLTLATHQLRQAVTGLLRATQLHHELASYWGPAPQLIGPAAGLVVCLLAATLAVLVGGPPMVVFGVVSVVVADGAFLLCGALGARAEQLEARGGPQLDSHRAEAELWGPVAPGGMVADG